MARPITDLRAVSARRRHRPAGAALGALAAGLVLAAAPARALDLRAMWDFGQPALSEQRFVAALDAASPDERLILRTQIARTHGLRRDFGKAREILADLAPALPTASAEARVRYQMELGRTWASGAHPPDLPPQARDEARRLFLAARDTAVAARLDELAIDAVHMMAFVDTAPAQQADWARAALGMLERSDQPAAKRWEGSLRNNLGVALKEQGEPEAAIEQFRLSRAAYLRDGRTQLARYADWMIGWTERGRGRLAAALEIQLRLEREWAAAGEADADVFEELDALYTALGDPARAAQYRVRAKEAR